MFIEEAAWVQRIVDRLKTPVLTLVMILCITVSAKASSLWILHIERDECPAASENGIALVGGEPFVAMRSLAAGFGGHLTWIESTKESVLTTDRVVAVFKAGCTNAFINGQAVELSTPPDLSTGRMAIGVNDLALLGLEASIDYETKTVDVGYQRSSVMSASSSVEDGRITIVVEADYGFEYSDFVLRQPDRMVVDIHDAALSSSFQPVDVSCGAVKRVRAAMNRPGVVRVVVDLDASLGYTISYEQGPPARLVIRFNMRISEMLLDSETSIVRLTVKGDAPIKHGAPVADEDGHWHVDMSSATLADGVAELGGEGRPVEWVKASQIDSNTARVKFSLKQGYSPIVRPSDLDGSELAIDFAITVSEIDVQEEPGCTVTRITTSGPVEFKAFSLKSPERVGVDLPGVWAGGCGSMAVDSGGVEQIRFAQYTADIGRVVLDLAPKATGWVRSVEISPDKRVVTIRVGNSSIYGRTIMLDPGHGGSDPGASNDDLLEKDINLDISLRTRTLLLEAGATVLMTREDDSSVSLADRPRMANQMKPDVFVSIHCNSALNVFPCGTETYYYNMVPYSQELATHIHACLLKEIMLVDRKVRRKDYYVLRETQMPATLVEVGYLCTNEESEKLRQPEFRQKAARGLVNGLLAYFDSDTFTKWRTDGARAL